MPKKISDAKILIIATNGFEQSELEKPLRSLKEQGASVHVAAPQSGKIRGWQGADWGSEVSVDRTLAQVDMHDYDALVIPGGVINPDKLRTEEKAVNLVRDAMEQGKVIAAICHGVWLLAEADILRGRKVTSYYSIKTDIRNAGGEWVDEPVVTQDGIITSRKPDDLGVFINKIVEEIREGSHERQRRAG